MKNEFYVYVYCNPLKEGDYTYSENNVNISFNYEPFYIGKGKGTRMKDHIREAKDLSINNHKLNTIRKIWRFKKEPIIYKIYENLTITDVNLLERLFIKIIGRSNKKLGPLTNLTDGADGGDTFSGATEEEKIRRAKDISIRNKGKSGKYERTEEIINKIKTSVDNYYSDENILAEHSEKTKKGMLEKGYTSEKISELTKEGMKKVPRWKLQHGKNKKQSAETIKKRVDKIKGQKRTEQQRKNISDSLMNKIVSNETKQKQSEARFKYLKEHPFIPPKIHVNTIIKLYFDKVFIKNMHKTYNEIKPIEYPILKNSEYICKLFIELGFPSGSNKEGEHERKKIFLQNHRPEEFYTNKYDIQEIENKEI
jgi:hypothetical protein